MLKVSVGQDFFQTGLEKYVPVLDRDGTVLHYFESGFMMICFMDDPNEAEIGDFTPVGEKQSYIYKPNDVLCLLYRGGCTPAYYEMFFHCSVDSNTVEIPMIRNPYERYGLTRVLVDRRTNKIKTLGIVSFSPRTSQLLSNIFRKQESNPISVAEYQRQIKEIQQESLENIANNSVLIDQMGT